MNSLQLQQAHPFSGTSKLFIDGLETATVDDAAFIKAAQERLFPTIGLLPPLVRWMSATGRFVLFERPPQIQEITYTQANKGDIRALGENYFTSQTYSIPLPWMLYGFEFGYDYYPTGMHAYALKKPVSSPQDRLGLLPLPNFYTTGSMCIPPREALEPTTIGEGINIAYSSIWDAGFNDDLPLSFSHCRARRRPLALLDRPEGRTTGDVARATTTPKMLARWEKKSLNDLVAIRDWCPPSGVMDEDAEYSAPRTVQSLIDYFLVRESLMLYSEPATNIKLAIYQCCMQAKKEMF